MKEVNPKHIEQIIELHNKAPINQIVIDMGISAYRQNFWISDKQ